ncbi:zinc ABC transporter substrate-binding protein [Algoriphagus sp.]|uniref:metal ABC transporter solute-binding protein, Zn/Mn family n=1 Tax=Algoriphagus sp. TaxID=1872435 RepID=UPI00260CFBBC|nr:zinc ABC transporter substrate-binding protein [Algoriphagus sp.]
MKHLLLWVLFFALFSCKIEDESAGTKPLIVATTSILADGVYNLVGENAEVVSLMPAGVDPHLYKASVRDLDLLQKADLVVYHGLFLEGKMTEIFEKLEFNQSIINISTEIPDSLLIRSGPEAHSVDPHIWFDVKLWSLAMNYTRKELIKWKPEWKVMIEENATLYQLKLNQLDKEIQAKVQELKTTGQALITAHDAFAYFGKAYDFEVKGLQGLSTLSEPGIRDLTDLAEFVAEQKIRAVFAEQTISPKAINALVAAGKNQGHEIKLAGPLYTDSLDQPGTPAGTYIGMIETNLQIIFENLKP